MGFGRRSVDHDAHAVVVEGRRSGHVGAWLRVYNDRGAFRAAATISDRVRPGVAMAPKQYWRRLTPGTATPNATTPERDADMAGAPTFHDNRVGIVVDAPAAKPQKETPPLVR